MSVGGRKAAVMSDEAQPAITMITMITPRPPSTKHRQGTLHRCGLR